MGKTIQKYLIRRTKMAHQYGYFCGEKIIEALPVSSLEDLNRLYDCTLREHTNPKHPNQLKAFYTGVQRSIKEAKGRMGMFERIAFSIQINEFENTLTSRVQN